MAVATPDEVQENIEEVEYGDAMNSMFLRYATDVLMNRALPDVRDGLKPSQRRVLVTMNDLHLRSNGAFKKSARTVGQCLGLYHPHG